MSRLSILDTVIIPAWDKYLPPKFNTRQAQAMIYTIGRQESRFEHMLQIGGPAVSFWQFEGGPLSGTQQVLTHLASRPYALEVCARMGVKAERTAVYEALKTNVALGAVFARLLLYTDPRALPPLALLAEQDAWDTYIRSWHPGRPHRETWGKFWKEALEGLT